MWKTTITIDGRYLLKWWVLFFISLLLPFTVVTASYAFGMEHPGVLKRVYWEVFSFAVFLLGAVTISVLLFRARFGYLWRIGLGVFVVPLLVLSALAMTVRSNCAPIPQYLGDKLEN